MISNDISLLSHNTFNLEYKAKCYVSFSSEEEIKQFLKEKACFPQPIIVIGDGANILFVDNFKGTVLHPDIQGIEVEERYGNKVIISAGAGTQWDDFVTWCISHNYSGVENLSIIPGTVGATPVQNIGAYGCEVSSLIHKARAISLSDGNVKEFSNDECRFGYRDSIFKNELKGQYIFTKVYFALSTSGKVNCDFGRLAEDVKKFGEATPINIRKAVIQQRESKLPDHRIIGNAGSFFKNPIVEKEIAENILQEYPEMPCYDDINGKKKLSAAWLIDHSGLRGKRIGDAAVYDRQPLVIVNYGKASGKEILELSQIVQQTVLSKFGVYLKKEVEVISI